MTGGRRELGPRLGLGVGLDLPWSGPYGFVDGRIAPRTRRFLERHADRFAYMFASWQPRDRSVPRAADYFAAFDDLFAGLPYRDKALHPTALNLASPTYDRTAIIDLVNALVERYGLRWVNEDLGLWSVLGRPLPYPQPPPLTARGIACCTAICRDVDARLAAPLVVEFPGFEVTRPPQRATWLHGTLDAYDVFREIVEGAGVHCNLDTGHLLTWRWLAGHRGDALLDGLDRLPLDRCIEIHCAGTVATADGIVDAHHGVLLDMQLELARRLMARCPALRVVTYEDPRFDDDGVLPPELAASLDALDACVRAWLADAPPPADVARGSASPAPTEVADAPWEIELWSRFADDDAFGEHLRAPLPTRDARGCGRLETIYRDAVGRALATRSDVDAILRDFFASPSAAEWSEVPWSNPGRCLEDAFGRFLAPGSDEHLTACARALAVHPDPPFTAPDGFVRAPGGWFALGGDDGTTLFAALHGRLVTGPITTDIRDALRGTAVVHDAAVHDRLVALGLCA